MFFPLIALLAVNLMQYLKMNKLILGFLVFHWVFIFHLNAQNLQEIHLKEIKARSELWNIAYNSRDSITFYTLFDSLTIISSAGGRWIGMEDCKRLCRSLYMMRPDITWTNKSTVIELNERILVAYESGEWIENWTESGDQTKSEITGKYCIMWRFKNDDWRIISAIFTPLTCIGSYCSKSK